MERRTCPRVKFQFPCAFIAANKECEGVIIDLSEGGLCLRTQVAVSTGDQLNLRIQARGKTLEVKALVWHSRQVRQCSTNAVFYVIGLMLVDAPETYFEFLPDTQRKTNSPPDQQEPSTERTETSAFAQAPAQEESSELNPYHIRVKQLGAPRTRVLSLSAESLEKARSLAMAELGNGWEVLGIEAA
jgi:hypothetical protein